MGQATPHDPDSESGADVAGALTDAALRRASSAAIFERGRTYAASGAVAVLRQQATPRPAIHAQVSGTDLYSTEVWVEDGEVDGRCDCPAAADGWFCKHQVALALVWRAQLAGEEPAVDEAARKKVQASAKRAQTLREQHQALGAFVRSLDAAALADKLLALAERDAAIARELQQWRKLRQAREQGADLKPLVTELLAPGRGFLSRRESFDYARRAEAVVPLLREARERDAAAAAALSLHALRRAWAALEQADDSDGDIGGVCRAIGEQWVAALQAAGAQPAAFGDTYLRVQLDDPFGCFDTAAAEAAMGSAALARYRRALAERWRQVKDEAAALAAKRGAKAIGRLRHGVAYWSAADERTLQSWTLQRLHLEQLERAGDIEGAIAVLREDLSDAPAWRRLTQFLESHGRLREAFANAEQALKAHPDDWQLQDDLLGYYERDGWTEEALALRQRRFEHSPSVQGYHEVLRAAAAAGHDTARLREQMLRAIEAREVQGAPRRVPAAGRSAGPRKLPPIARSVPNTAARDVSLRAAVLGSEGRWAEACALAQPPALCHPQVLQQIALHLDAAHRKQALALLQRVFEATLAQSSSPYREALALVDEIAKRLDAEPRAAWLARLRTEHKAKRSFVRALPTG